MIYRYIFTLLLITAATSAGFSQDFPEPQKPPRLVNDFASFLRPGEINSLEKKLAAFNRETSSQVAIIIVPSLNGFEKADYTIRLAEKWGVGRKGKDNGILIMVKPKTSREKGEVFIATGYGLEGAVPDALAKRIVELDILPAFRQGEYFEGLDKATNTIISLTKGEFTAEEYTESHSGSPAEEIGGFVLFLLIISISLLSRARRTRQYAVGHNIPFWTAMFLAGSTSRSHHGSYGSFSSGSGSFGGFGGFGGGGFGGGGAGGSW